MLGNADCDFCFDKRLLIGKRFDYCRLANGTPEFQMTPAEFKRKWARYSGKETAAYQEHFNDLCALLDQPTPATADPALTQFAEIASDLDKNKG